jgi:hypothetical protein
MKRFDHVVEILETAVHNETIGKHGNFWRNKTREQFIATKVFGKILLVPGKASDSNIIKAMRGLAPFGVDTDNPPPGAIFDRMPAGRPAVPEQSIQFIEKWINDGCPDDDVADPVPPANVAVAGGAAAAADGAAATPDLFVRFFREFDQFFAFEANNQTRAAIGDFFGIADSWPGFNQSTDLPAWTDAIADPTAKNAAQFLSDNQLRVMKAHFGDPADEAALTEALWQFGKGSLPADAQRPQDRFHRMNGHTMWLMWLAFADASIRLGMNAPQWTRNTKCICLGMVGDALFRTDRPPNARLKITRYSAQDPDVRARVVNDFVPLSGDALQDAVIGLAREALFGAPVG